MAKSRLSNALVPSMIALAITVGWSVFAYPADGFLRTLAFLIAVLGGGIVLIRRTSTRLEDPSLLKLQFVFLGKIALLLLLSFSWDHTLRNERAVLQGDQERYYHQAVDVGRAGLTPSAIARIIQNINYPGIIYIYGAVLRVFGENVFCVALFNGLATLVTVLLLARLCYRLKPDRGRHDWLIGLSMLLPDIIACDVMTSRDTLAMSLLSIAVLLVALQLLDPSPQSWIPPLLVAASLVALAAVRTTALIPAVASIIVLLLKYRARMRMATVVAAVVIAVAFLMVAPGLSHSLGGYKMTYMQILSVTVVNPDGRLINGFTWSDRSIGRLLVPRSLPHAILLSIPRMMAYLIVPLPRVKIDGQALLAGDWMMIQEILAASSSVLYLALFPLALVALYRSIAKKDSTLALVAPFWLTFITIASGTAILQARYRVMALPFLCGCIWLGRAGSRRQIAVAYGVWTAMLGAAVSAAVLYKYILV